MHIRIEVLGRNKYGPFRKRLQVRFPIECATTSDAGPSRFARPCFLRHFQSTPMLTISNDPRKTMNRNLEEELLNCPIGDLDDADQANGADEAPTHAASLRSNRPIAPLVDTNTSEAVLLPLPMAGSIVSAPPPHQAQHVPLPTPVLHRAGPPTFMEQVLRILDDAQMYNFENIISWQPGNNSFKVHRIKDFETKILPRYLDQTRVRSFQRQ